MWNLLPYCKPLHHADRSVCALSIMSSLHDVQLSAEYFALYNEVHARPFPVFESSASIVHLTTRLDPDNARQHQEQAEHLQLLLEHFSVPLRIEPNRNVTFDLGPLRLRTEFHSEFTNYTFYKVTPGNPLADTPLSSLPQGWLGAVPGEPSSWIHLGLERGASIPESYDVITDALQSPKVIGSFLASEAAQGWTTFQLDAQGMNRILLLDFGMSPSRCGRVVQRLLELESYRMLALLALPINEQVQPASRAIDNRLTHLIQSLNQLHGIDEEKKLLASLTELAVENENLRALSAHRYSATCAYHDIVQARLRELKEQRIEGFQPISEFLSRRMDPIRHTVEVLNKRLENTSSRIDKATDLLRTRVDLNLESQNKQILTSINRRSALQLRLQTMVEGLSIVAISYYALGLLKYLVDALDESGMAINKPLVLAILVPLTLLVVYSITHHLKKKFLLSKNARG